MIPNKKRAKKLDDLLRVLGFHARASGSFKAVAPAIRSVSDNKRKDAAAGRFGSGHTAEGLTQEEKEESMWKRIEVSKKRRPETPVEQTASGTGAELRCARFDRALARDTTLGRSTVPLLGENLSD